MYLNPILSLPRSRFGRIAWSLLRRPLKSHEFPAEHERLVTPEDLVRFGFWTAESA